MCYASLSREAAQTQNVRKVQVNSRVKLGIFILLLIVVFSNLSDKNKYGWPPEKIADTTHVDSMNAAYDYELAEGLLVWEETKSLSELLLKLDSLQDYSNQALTDEIIMWVEENEEAIEAMVEGAKKPYCDFSYGNPRPYLTYEDISRTYPELLNVMDLLLFKAWHYFQIDEPDSAIFMISSVTRVLSHLENQRDGIFIAKLVEMLAIQHVARSLKYSIDQTHDVDLLRKIYNLSESYLQRRHNMDEAMSEELFRRIDFKHFARKQIRETIGEIESVVDTLDSQGLFDSLETDIDFQNINFQSIDIERSAEEVAYFAEKEYLKGLYPFYQSYSRAFKKNDPSLVALNSRDYGLNWFAIKLAIRMLFVDPEKPKVPTKILGQLTGKIMHIASRPDYRAYITDYHGLEAEFRIVLKASQLKLSKLSGTKLNSSEDVDPFNKFKPLKVILSNDKFVVYSYGPDLQDGKGLKLDTYRSDDQNWSGRDLGYEFRW